MSHESPDLSGQVAVVTGGNGGIGLALGHALGRAGAAVSVWGRNQAKNAAAAEALGAEGVRVHATRCDVAREDDVAAATDATLAAFGRIDVCVANAGATSVGGLLDLTFEEWREVLGVNLDGTFLTIQHTARAMVEQGEGGAVVVLSSISAIHGAPDFPHYAAAKSGVLGLTRSAAVDLARHRIRVNALLPGWTTTDMTRAGYESARFRTATTKRTPLGRWAEPAEIARAGVWLADRTLAFHTGQTLVVDGGYTIF